MNGVYVHEYIYVRHIQTILNRRLSGQMTNFLRFMRQALVLGVPPDMIKSPASIKLCQRRRETLISDGPCPLNPLSGFTAFHLSSLLTPQPRSVRPAYPVAYAALHDLPTSKSRRSNLTALYWCHPFPQTRIGYFLQDAATRSPGARCHHIPPVAPLCASTVITIMARDVPSCSSVAISQLLGECESQLKPTFEQLARFLAYKCAYLHFTHTGGVGLLVYLADYG